MKIDQVKQITTNDGTVMFLWKGKLHNPDGPALIHPDGKQEYYINGIMMDKERHKETKRLSNGLPWFKGAARGKARV